MLLCLFILSPTTETIYTSGLPSLTKYFGIDSGLTQITSTLYFLGFALGYYHSADYRIFTAGDL